MSKIIDVSSKLGEYMLKGWVLTDSPCATPGCNVPLMRSPQGTSPVVQFCVNCDRDPQASAPVSSPVPKAEDTPTLLRRTTRSSSFSAESLELSSHHSRSSTPATDVSSALSSPTFAPPVETEESRRRRQQSDAASSEIGKRLLKGWAMLADECPNPRCYGIPLVRPPRVGGSKDSRKECVACETAYVTEKDMNGWDRLVPSDSSAARSEPPSNEAAVRLAQGAHGSPDKEKLVLQVDTQGAPATSSNTVNSSALLQEGRRDTAIAQRRSATLTTRTATDKDDPSTSSSLESTARSLQRSLLSLSERLELLSGGHMILDPASISQTADAIGRVAHALSEVKKLQGQLNFT
ncbi:hypothetical protein PUNSTDRAFT_142655 [Punctularia strigosozonata HHB-11173 SS5]|uniref:uncharacterized protein n=1 Tax=Punctularia strigosozonata (strain HHB-11173) TaxID=741275 RepID=UPI00044166C7|nr:uncharacterized protein PUNSTDRAFT_142655 [Punctularia strigosozonata HHB-11173 SS5]EIN10698.1 hypothetical protein PUNSTDRAFT_142655 [Punctularia strigosozonata HHB-11173 SS5]